MSPRNRTQIIWFAAAALLAALMLWWFWPTLFPPGPRYDRWINES